MFQALRTGMRWLLNIFPPLIMFSAVIITVAIGIVLYLQHQDDEDFWRKFLQKLFITAIVYGVLALLTVPRCMDRPMHLIVPATPVPSAGTGISEVKSVQLTAPVHPRAYWPYIVGTAAILGIGVLGLLMQKRHPDQSETEPKESQLIREIRRRLELDDQIRNAIIACYAEMDELFSKQISSSRSLTAREFAAMLRSRGAEEPEIAALTSVFEKARYSPDPCDEGDRTLAVEALKVLEAHYGRGGNP